MWSRPLTCTMCVNWMQQCKPSPCHLWDWPESYKQPSPCHLWDWPESYKQPFCSIGLMQQCKPSPCHLWDWPQSYKQPFSSIGLMARGDLVNNRILQSLTNKTWYTSIILCFTNMLQMIDYTSIWGGTLLGVVRYLCLLSHSYSSL